MPCDDPRLYATELGRFLGQWAYEHFAVLTYREEVDASFAMAQARRWVRRIEKFGGGKVYWVATAEVGDQGRVHSHLLTIGTKAVPLQRLKDAWHRGDPHIEPCRDSVASARYVLELAGTPRLLDFDLVLPMLGDIRAEPGWRHWMQLLRSHDRQTIETPTT